MQDVVAAVICRANQYLVGLRPSHKRHGDLWEFPGGKLLAGESLAQAAARELPEELSVEVTSVGAVLSSIQDESAGVAIHFAKVKIDGEPTPIEHQRLTWADRSELARLTLAPADAQFVAEVLND